MYVSRYTYIHICVFCIFVFIDICVYIPVNLCIDIFTHHERTWKTPKTWENSRYALLNKIVVPETQDMLCHDSASLWASPKIFEPRFLSDSECMHPGVGRLSTISNFRFSFLSGIGQFHILSALGYIHIGGGWNNPHTIQPFLSWLISQPTLPPQGTYPEIKPD